MHHALGDGNAEFFSGSSCMGCEIFGERHGEVREKLRPCVRQNHESRLPVVAEKAMSR